MILLSILAQLFAPALAFLFALNVFFAKVGLGVGIVWLASSNRRFLDRLRNLPTCWAVGR